MKAKDKIKLTMGIISKTLIDFDLNIKKISNDDITFIDTKTFKKYKIPKKEFVKIYEENKNDNNSK